MSVTGSLKERDRLKDDPMLQILGHFITYGIDSYSQTARTIGLHQTLCTYVRVRPYVRFCRKCGSFNLYKCVMSSSQVRCRLERRCHYSF